MKTNFRRALSVLLAVVMLSVLSSPFSLCTKAAVLGDLDGNGKIDLSDAIRIIPEGLFDSCAHLVRVDLPQSMIRIDTLAFSGCTDLGTISMHTSLSSIGISAFAMCENLSRIELYGSTSELSFVNVGAGNEAFLGAEIKEVGE
jgi:hypothetical protein